MFRKVSAGLHEGHLSDSQYSEGFEENADLYTRQVSVQPLVTEQNNRTGYESGIISHWYRRNNEESGQVELTMEARQQ